ncbi:MAG: tRNA (adenosine(37)-N6)-threonylcarbamoyltransferase complex dimerization subunit type 1 TsaB [bacterium]
MILSIDTSTLGLSLALADEKNILAELNLTGDKPCGEKIVESFDKMLKITGLASEQLDKIILTTGPGSFTGLRIGMTFAKGLCAVNRIELRGIDTHIPVAWRLRKVHKTVLITQDARKGQLYASGYESKGEEVNVLIPLQSWDPLDLISCLPSCPVSICGTGIRYLKPYLSTREDLIWLDHPWWYSSLAKTLLSLWESEYTDVLDPTTALPHYFRRSQAETGN